MKKITKWWNKSSKKQQTLITVVALAIICIAAAGIVGSAGKKSEKVQGKSALQETKAKKSDISNTIVGTGNLELDDSDKITIPSDIEIKEVLVESGDSVSKGDVLATVEPASVASAIEELQDEIDEIDEEIRDNSDETVTETIKAKVAGRVKKIYVQKGDDAGNSITENGALMLLSLDGKMAVSLDGVSDVSKEEEVTVTLSDGTTKTGTIESVSGDSCVVTLTDNGVAMGDTVTVTKSDGTSIGSGTTDIHKELAIMAAGGTVTAVRVTENQKVYASSRLLTLNRENTEYQSLLAEREEMTETMQKLVAMQESGTITADIDGTVGEVNVTAEGESAGADTTSAKTASTTKASTDTASATATSTTKAITTKSTGISNVGFISTATATQETADTDEKLQLQIQNGKDSTKNTLAIITPKAGDTPQTEIEVSDGSYMGKISWSKKDKSFKAGTAYTAKVTLTAADGYCFGADSIVKVETGTISDITVAKDGKTIQFSLTYPETEKDDSDKSQSEKEKQESNSGSQNDGQEQNGVAAQQGNTSQQGVTSQNMGDAQSVTTAQSQTVSQSSTASQSSGTSGTTTSESQDTESDDGTLTAFTLASNDTMILSVNVDELDINSVSKEQEAEVTLDAIEDKTFTGTVTKVSNSASSTNGGVAKYTVKISIPKDEKMKAGMNASATIIVEQKKDVITIPVSAVSEKGGESFVYTKKDSDGNLSGEQTVTTGLSDGDMVEITEGLSEGDTVYYQSAVGTSDSSDEKKQKGDFGEFPGNGGEPPSGEMPSGGQMPSGGPGQGGN